MTTTCWASFCAEVGDVRQGHAEQLRDDGGDAAEVRGAADGALESLGDAEHLDGGGEPRRVDLLDRRREQQVGAGLGGERRVVLLLARVAVEVGALVELGGVDEQRDDDSIALLARAPISDRWPSCSAPIVGTRPIVSPSRRAGASVARSSATVRTVFMRRAGLGGGGSSDSVQFPADTGATSESDKYFIGSISSELDNGLIEK